MHLNLLSLRTLVTEAPCIRFDMNDMIFTSTLIWYNTDKQKQDKGVQLCITFNYIIIACQ